MNATYDCRVCGLFRCKCDPTRGNESANAVREMDLSRGFDAGNYASAYETTDYSEALARLSMNRSEAYRVAFTLGFFGSYEPNEMGEHEQAYREALASDHGQRCVALGYVDPSERVETDD